MSSLGAGGMGAVYKAHDTRLDRTVAIKILLNLGNDAERRERFTREARLLASLDHPHICALHDVGREGATDYIVMPLLAGETLAARIARGPMPLPESLRIAGQIADALDRAHRHGIVHRDLKPGNVMLTASGARLLDFGLARLDTPVAEEATAPVTQSPLTEIGAVMGTLPYMAPEQVAGQRADVRSDIWSFGCVLYEMIAGRRAFAAPTQALLMGAIVSAEPPSLSAAGDDVPPAVSALITGMLAKNPDERWQSMRDVKHALSLVTAADARVIASSSPAHSGKGWRRAIAIVGVLAIGALAAAVLLSRPESGDGIVRFDVAAAGSGALQTWTDIHPYFAASPDGTRIAFVANTDGRSDIWIKQLDAEKPERLADTTGGLSPFWAPDGQSVAFFADGQLKRKALAGGAAQPLCAVEGSGFNGAWSPTGIILWAEWGTRRLMRVPEHGGQPVIERQGPEPFGWPQFLPDGRHFLYTTLDLERNLGVRAFVGQLDSEQTTPLVGVESRAEFAAGRLFFWREGSVISQPFDDRTLQPTGPAVPIADEVHAFALTGFGAFSITPRLLVYQAGPVAGRLVWLTRQGLEIGMVGSPADITTVRLSPNQSEVAYAARDPRLGTTDIFIHELARNVSRRLTSDRGAESGPMWSPDGKTIVYTANRRGPPHLHARPASGAGPEREVLAPADAGPQFPRSFTPDGAYLLFMQPNPGTDYDLMLMPWDSRSAPVPIVQSKRRESQARLSADGQWLAFSSDESGRAQVYVQPLRDAHGRRQVSSDGGAEPRWRHDGRELYYLGGPKLDQMMAVSLTPAGGTLELGNPRPLFAWHRGGDYDVSRDGERFLVVLPDPIAEAGTLSAVLNWTKIIEKQ